MAKQLTAVVGIGQTKHDTKRDDVSIAGLVREAAVRALEDADMTWSDIDAVVVANAPEHIGREVAVKDRVSALKNPYAHLHMPDISMETVLQSPILWDPIRFLECCPSSDGACAMVMTNERVAKSASKPPAWILGTAIRSEPLGMAGRDEVNPRAGRDCAG